MFICIPYFYFSNLYSNLLLILLTFIKKSSKTKALERQQIRQQVR